jgi:hypothetical protein
MDRLRKLFARLRRKRVEEKKEVVEPDPLYPKLDIKSQIYPDLSGFYCAYPDVADNYWRYLYLIECNR